MEAILMTDTPTTFEHSQGDPQGPPASTQSVPPVVDAGTSEPSAATGLPEILAKVERAKQEWEATVDSLPQFVCLLDERGTVMRANRVVETWGLGSVRSISGVDFHHLLHPRCLAHTCYLQSLLQEINTIISSGHRSDLEAFDPVLRRDLHVTLAPILGQAVTAQNMVVIIIEDISERTQAELTLKRYTARVEFGDDFEEALLATRKAVDRVVAWL